jgi:hypothetical protein
MGDSDKILKKLNSILFPNESEAGGHKLLAEIESLIEQKK